MNVSSNSIPQTSRTHEVSLSVRSILDSLPSAHILLGEDDRIILINQRAKSLLLLEAVEQQGHKAVETISDLPDCLNPLKEVLKQENFKETPRGEVSVSLATRSEEPSILGYSLKEIQQLPEDPASRLRVFIFSDITDVLKDQAESRKIREELAQSRKLASMGTLVASVGHELNSPLIGISMNTELIRRNLKNLKLALKQPSEKEAASSGITTAIENALDGVNQIFVGVKKSSTLISELLDYSKPLRVAKKPVDLKQLLSGYVDNLKKQELFRNCKITLMTSSDKPSDGYYVLGDQDKLEQVFFNLLKNASEATQGKGNIQIDFQRIPHKTLPKIAVSVSDDGTGIEPADLDRVFEPFYTTKGRHGTGLGLSISYRTIELHGGTISNTSSVGKGATFIVNLPSMPSTDEQKETAIHESL